MMFWRKGKGVKIIKELKLFETQKKGVPVVDPSQGEHMLCLSYQVEFLYNVSL